MLEAMLTLAALTVIGTLAWGAVRGAPWVPTRRRDTERVLALAAPQPGAVVADLGCGSAGVLAGFAARGCRVRGWELAVLPWMIARWRFRRAPDAEIVLGDFWNARIAGADIVYLFLMPKVLPRVAEKLRRELRPGAMVITYVWPLPGWIAEHVDRTHGVPPLYRYRV